MLPNKNELQTLKYINEANVCGGGSVIKRHLFESWMQLYEKEISFLTPADGGPRANAPLE
jgi:hypothetical protein